MRVFELAKQLNIPIKELMELVEMEGIVVANHFAALTPAQVRTLKIAAGAEDAAEEDEVPAGTAPEPVAEAEAPAAEEAATPAAEPAPEPEPEPESPKRLEIFGDIVIKDLATRLDSKPNVLIAALMKMGVFASINQTVTRDVARKLAEAQGFEVITEAPKPKPVAPPPPPPPPAPVPAPSEASAANSDEAKPAPAVFQPKELKEKEKKKKDKPGKPASSQAVVGREAVTRPPVVTFMGHVDHGKTSLLDKIRKANVVSGEAGGITQHIGAYTINVNGHEITFLDTPGHAAFSAMRARGATVTDIVVIVISAEDGIKPQTLEAIKHAQDAGVTLMVAINKIDLPKANLERVKQDMQRHQIASEDWGGSTVTVPVSAMTGQGIDELLSMILLQAEIMDLKAIPNGSASGYVIEAELEKGMGPTASVLVTEGLLQAGDVVLCGEACGKIKALIDHTGKRVKSAGPSHAVKIIGLGEVPTPGDRFEVLKTEREARERSTEMKEANRLQGLQGPARGLTLDDLFAQAGMDAVEELRVILKCDVKGSQEAITAAVMDIKSDKVRLKLLGSGVGPINENDVLRAHAANAVIIGFNVNQENAAVKAAKAKGVDIQLYDIIYELIDEVKAAMLGLLKPVVQERVIGHAEIRALFKLTKGGSVAGCIVTDGRMRARARARVFRGKDVIYKGGIATLKRFQDEVSEVGNGQECGIRLENFDAFETGDVVEAFINENVKQDL